MLLLSPIEVELLRYVIVSLGRPGFGFKRQHCNVAVWVAASAWPWDTVALVNQKLISTRAPTQHLSSVHCQATKGSSSKLAIGHLVITQLEPLWRLGSDCCALFLLNHKQAAACGVMS
jgi:hypothetical protein